MTSIESKIKRARRYIELVRKETANLESLYKSGKLSYQEYFFKLSKLLKGKTERQWLGYYSNYIKLLKQDISLPALEKPNIPITSRAINPKIIIPLLILLLSIIAITYNEYTGFVILGNEEIISYPLSLTTNNSLELTINLSNIPTSLRLSGSLTGQGTFKVYALFGNESLLIADNSILTTPAINISETSQTTEELVNLTNITQITTSIIPSQIAFFNNSCIETCSISNPTSNIKLIINVENATQSLTSLTYTTPITSQATTTLPAIVTPKLSGKETFQLSENPEFIIEYPAFTSQISTKEEASIKQGDRWQTEEESIDIRLYDNNNNQVNLPVEITKDKPGKFTFTLESQRQIRAGRYKAIITLTKDSQQYTSEKTFSWGVLAINTYKPSYLPNENAFIGIAVLDDNGFVICDADVILNIISPSKGLTTLTTANKEILISPECHVLGVTKLPDYYTSYTTSQPGIYIMELTATHNGRINSIQSNFSVESYLDYDVARDGPTRIFPLVPYKMNITIKANKPYSGSITEKVPSSFEITQQEGLSINIVNNTKLLTWNAILNPGELRSFYYEFDAPDISPYLFLLGKLSLANYTEFRYWQIASDAEVLDTNVTGSRTVNRNVKIYRNGRLNVFFYWNEPGFIVPITDIRTWLEYAINTTAGDNSDTGTQVTDTCGSNAFVVTNTTPFDTDGCVDADAHGCFTDSAFISGGFTYKINISTEGTIANSERYIFGIKSCNISGVFDIGVDQDLLGSGGVLNNWFNLTVARMLFTHPNPSNASRRLLFANTSTPEFNQTVNLSARITNDIDFNYSIFSTNLTGSWRNWSIKYETGAADTDVVNWTHLRINVTSTRAIGWRYYANDTSRLPNASSINVLYPTDTIRPLFRNLTNNNRATYFNNDTTPLAGQVINLSINIIDNGDISHYRFATNNTGTWTNRTWVSLSGIQSVYTNWTRLTSSSTSGKYGWRYYANDSLGNLNASSVNTYVIESAIPETRGSSGPRPYKEIIEITSTSTSSSTTTSTIIQPETTIAIEQPPQEPTQPDLAKTIALIISIILVIVTIYEFLRYHLPDNIKTRTTLFIMLTILIITSQFTYTGMIVRVVKYTNIITLINLRYIIAIDIILLINYIKLRLSRKQKNTNYNLQQQGLP